MEEDLSVNLTPNLTFLWNGFHGVWSYEVYFFCHADKSGVKLSVACGPESEWSAWVASPVLCPCIAGVCSTIHVASSDLPMHSVLILLFLSIAIILVLGRDSRRCLSELATTLEERSSPEQIPNRLRQMNYVWESPDCSKFPESGVFNILRSCSVWEWQFTPKQRNIMRHKLLKRKRHVGVEERFLVVLKMVGFILVWGLGGYFVQLEGKGER